MSALKYIFLSHCQTVCENCKLLLEVHVHVCAVSSSIAELVVELVIKLKKRLVRASWLVIVRAYQRRPTSVLMRWDMRV